MLFQSHGVLVGHRSLFTQPLDLFSPNFWSTTPFLAYDSPHPFLEEWLSQIGSPPLNIVRRCAEWNVIEDWLAQKRGISVLPSDVEYVAHSPEKKICH